MQFAAVLPWQRCMLSLERRASFSLAIMLFKMRKLPLESINTTKKKKLDEKKLRANTIMKLFDLFVYMHG